MASAEYDAIVVGSGPNGLSAAVSMAGAGLSVLVVEGSDRIGGGCRSEELTLPGFVHDTCSTIHPFAAASPFFRRLPLGSLGVSFEHPELPFAQLLDDEVVAAARSIDETVARLGSDGPAYRELFAPLVEHWETLFDGALRPIRIPRAPALLGRFGISGAQSCQGLVRRRFRKDATRALIAGVAGHALTPIDRPGTASLALLMTVGAHAVGWPCVRGGSKQIALALGSHLAALGGRLELDHRVDSLSELPRSKVVLLDLTVRQVAHVARDGLPRRFLRRLARFPLGPGVFKLDWALDGPIPWRHADAARAGTVHIAPSFQALGDAERQAARGEVPERPYVILAQQSRFDATRAPDGKHTAWAYCHVPAGSDVDMTAAVEREIERHAPGFRDRILARHTLAPKQIEARNPNLSDGNITGGSSDLWHMLFRPSLRFDPYTTPDPALFICSSSTPPGAGVHGMCGYWAAASALRRHFGIRLPDPLDRPALDESLRALGRRQRPA